MEVRRRESVRTVVVSARSQKRRAVAEEMGREEPRPDWMPSRQDAVYIVKLACVYT